MTRKKLTQREQVRKLIDKRVDDIIERAQEMIQQDVPVILSFRLAISWELEISYYEPLQITPYGTVMLPQKEQ